jgi:pimeloyl-ACP methyl ester carboxylesterase
MVPAAYTLERYAADVAAVVRALGLTRVHVVGHSLGALVAAVFAAASPVPVESLALIDIRLRRRAGARPVLDRLRQFPHPRYVSEEEAVRRFRLLPTGTAATPEVLAHVATRALRRADDGRWTLKFDRQTLRDAIPREVVAELQQLDCPILWVRGEKSVIASARAAEEVREILPRAEVAVIEGAYHHVMLDAPERFLQVVGGFLRAR